MAENIDQHVECWYLSYWRASSKESEIRALAASSYIRGIREDSGYNTVDLFFLLDGRFKNDCLRGISAKYENLVHLVSQFTIKPLHPL